MKKLNLRDIKKSKQKKLQMLTCYDFQTARLLNETDLDMTLENHSHCDWDYQVGDKELHRKDGILGKLECQYQCDPWTITSIHMNGKTRVQCGTKSE